MGDPESAYLSDHLNSSFTSEIHCKPWGRSFSEVSDPVSRANAPSTPRPHTWEPQRHSVEVPVTPGGGRLRCHPSAYENSNWLVSLSTTTMDFLVSAWYRLIEWSAAGIWVSAAAPLREAFLLAFKDLAWRALALPAAALTVAVCSVPPSLLLRVFCSPEWGWFT